MKNNYQMKFFTKLLFFVIIGSMQLNSISTLIQPFYGDITYETYLKEILCNYTINEYSFKSKEFFILIQDLQLTDDEPIVQNTQQTIMDPNYYYCFQEHLLQIHSNRLHRLLSPQDGDLKLFKDLYLTFDFTSIRIEKNEHKSKFMQTMLILENLYHKCNQCKPFVLLFRYRWPFEQWIQELLPSTRRYFRSILIYNVSYDNETVIHIRPILYGCQLYPGMFVAKNQADFDVLKMNYKSCNLNGNELQVLTHNNTPFCKVIENEDKTYKLFEDDDNLEAEMLHLLELNLNFRSNITLSNFIWGFFNSTTKRYEGDFLHIQNGTFDIGLCAMTQNYLRSQIIDFTYYTYLDSATFLTFRPELEDNHLIILRPFNQTLWLFIIITFITLSLVMYLVTKMYVNVKLNYLKIISIMYMIVLGQQTNLELYQHYGIIKFLFGIWLLATLILMNLFASKFYSIMTVPKFQQPIETIDQMLSAVEVEHQYLLSTRLFVTVLLQANRQNEIYYRLGKHVNKSLVFEKYLTIQRTIEIFEEKKGNVLLINLGIYLRTLAHLYRERLFSIGKETLSFNIIGMGLPKKSPLLEVINEKIAAFHEYGFVLRQGRIVSENTSAFRLESKRYPFLSSKAIFFEQTSGTELIHSLQIIECRSVFIQYVFGIVLTIFAFVIELIVSRYVPKQNLKKDVCLGSCVRPKAPIKGRCQFHHYRHFQYYRNHRKT